MKTPFPRFALLGCAWATLGLASGCANQKAPLSTEDLVAPKETVATSGPSVSLLTLSPGPELFSAHGHTALEVDEDGDASTPNLIYNYGGFSMQEIFENPTTGLVTLLTENVTGLRDRFGAPDSDPRHSYLAFYNNYLNNPLVERIIHKDRLQLTAAQTRTLIDRLAQEWQTAGREYPYKNYNDNCTTRIRDHLFLVVGGETLVNEARALGDSRTYEQLSIEAMNIAARAQIKTHAVDAPGEIIIVPPSQQRAVRAALATLDLTLPATVASGEEFYADIRVLRDQLASYVEKGLKKHDLKAAFLNAANVIPLFTQQIERLAVAPDGYDALFLPSQLRHALTEGRLLNPATGLPLINEADSVIHASVLHASDQPEAPRAP